MANVNVRQVNGGEVTVLKALHSFLLDDGTNSNYIEATSLFNLMASEGALLNAKLSVTVSSNDLVVALKTWAGSDPSTSDVAYVKINGTLRAITAATSITLADATNWFNLGGTPHAALENNLFAYAVWDSNSSIVALSIARIPYGKLVSEFSATTTNEKYLGNQANFTATDDVVNIGRFAATLSAAAGHVWTVPTFTSANLINTPTFESDWYTWIPSPTGYSAVPTNVVYRYRIVGKEVTVQVREVTAGTSNATTMTMTAPFTSLTLSNAGWWNQGQGVDNSVSLTTPIMVQIGSGSGTLSFFKDTSPSGTAWTNTNSKRISFVELKYQIA